MFLKGNGHKDIKYGILICHSCHMMIFILSYDDDHHKAKRPNICNIFINKKNYIKYLVCNSCCMMIIQHATFPISKMPISPDLTANPSSNKLRVTDSVGSRLSCRDADSLYERCWCPHQRQYRYIEGRHLTRGDQFTHN